VLLLLEVHFKDFKLGLLVLGLVKGVCEQLSVPLLSLHILTKLFGRLFKCLASVLGLFDNLVVFVSLVDERLELYLMPAELLL